MTRSHLYRLSAIVQKLKEGRYPNARTLSEELGCCQRTVLRCLDALRDDHAAPIEYDPRRRGFYLTDPAYTLPMMKLAEGELLALLLGLHSLSVCAGTGLEQPVRSLLSKLPLLLPEDVSVDLDALRRHVSFLVEPPRGDLERVAAQMKHLRQAVRERRRVRIDYYAPSRDERSERDVDPYHLRHFEGAWYLIGFCRLRGAYRTFGVDRIERLEVLAQTFEPRPDFSPDTYFDAAWRLVRGEAKHRVVARFDAYQARWMRGRAWHPTQEAREEPDGSLTLAFTVSGLGEIKRWLLQFGSHVEVVAPAELREEMAAEARHIHALYAREDLSDRGVKMMTSACSAG